MILTVTQNIEGKQIRDYKGIVFGEVVVGINMFKDIGAGLRNIVGGRSKGYEDELVQARADALMELAHRASDIGANAVVGVKMDYESMGTGGMMMVIASGSAVLVD